MHAYLPQPGLFMFRFECCSTESSCHFVEPNIIWATLLVAQSHSGLGLIQASFKIAHRRDSKSLIWKVGCWNIFLGLYNCTILPSGVWHDTFGMNHWVKVKSHVNSLNKSASACRVNVTIWQRSTISQGLGCFQKMVRLCVMVNNGSMLLRGWHQQLWVGTGMKFSPKIGNWTSPEAIGVYFSFFDEVHSCGRAGFWP